MRHEKLIKREDGTRIKIVVKATDNIYRGDLVYEYFILVCQPKKRTWCAVCPGIEYGLIDRKQRKGKVLEETLKIVTKEEIHEAKLELWNLLKPNPDVLTF